MHSFNYSLNRCFTNSWHSMGQCGIEHIPNKTNTEHTTHTLCTKYRLCTEDLRRVPVYGSADTPGTDQHRASVIRLAQDHMAPGTHWQRIVLPCPALSRYRSIPAAQAHRMHSGQNSFLLCQVCAWNTPHTKCTVCSSISPQCAVVRGFGMCPNKRRCITAALLATMKNCR